MSTSVRDIHPFRQRGDSESAILFIHGGGGHITESWGNFPQFLSEDPRLEKWDIFNLGYESNFIRLDDWWPPSRWFVRMDPDMAALAGWVRTAAADLEQYKDLAIICHSLGGLVVQRALLDDAALAARTSHLFLFGVSSNGFRKLALHWVMSQLREILPGSKFITGVRADWDRQFIKWKPPFKYLIAVGTEDGWVWFKTATAGFPEKLIRHIPGDHSQIVKPGSGAHPSVRLVVREITQPPARRAPLRGEDFWLEAREFRQTIAKRVPDVMDLDRTGRVELAIAYDGLGEWDEAVRVLTCVPSDDSDVKGTLAGRYKRRWQDKRTITDADSAMALYREGFDAATTGDMTAEKRQQAYYHGINVAFMQLAHERSVSAAQSTAREVLKHCTEDPASLWQLASEGEAHLLLGDLDRSADAYGNALRKAKEAWEVESMFTQATRVAGLLHRDDFVVRLTELFRTWRAPP